jgi:hypothetical protein
MYNISLGRRRRRGAEAEHQRMRASSERTTFKYSIFS